MNTDQERARLTTTAIAAAHRGKEKENMSLDLMRVFAPLTTGEIREPEVLDESDITILGRYRNVQYAVERGGGQRELRVGRRVEEWSRGDSPAKGQIYIVQTVQVEDTGYMMVGGRRTAARTERHLIRADIVPAGTYASLVARAKASAEAKAKAAKAAVTPHLIDIADYLPALAKVDPQAIATGISQRDDPLSVALDRSRKAPRLVQAPGRGPIRGVAAIADYLASLGVTLEAHGPRLAVYATKLDPAIRDVIDVFEELLVGHVSGKPVICVLSGHRSPEPAHTVAIPNVPVCLTHLEGDR